MELIGLGCIALAFSLYLAIPNRLRRKRRKEMGLPPKVKEPESWRDDPSVRWSDPRYFHRYGRRP